LLVKQKQNIRSIRGTKM